MEHRWITDIESFKAIAGDWDNVVRASPYKNPFQLSCFIRPWWDHFKDSAKLRILAIFDGEKLVGGIPLQLANGRGLYGFARVLSYVGGTAANYTEPLYLHEGEDLLPVLKKSLVERDDWDVLYLPDIRGENCLVSKFKRDNGDRLYDISVSQDHMNWAIDLSGGCDEFLNTISSKLKRDLRSKRKNLVARYGELSLKPIKGETAVREYFDIYRKFSLSAFSERDRRSGLEDERYSGFLKDLMAAMERDNVLAAHSLEAGGNIFAISFGYRLGRGFDWVLTGYNCEFKQFRPGYLLIEELIKYVTDLGETYYNWYGYERFYKGQWCNEAAPLYRFLLVRRSPAGVYYGMVQNVERRLRSNPAIVKITQRLKHA